MRGKIKEKQKTKDSQNNHLENTRNKKSVLNQLSRIVRRATKQSKNKIIISQQIRYIIL